METMIRGYMVQLAARFVVEDPILSQRFPRPLFSEVRGYQWTIKPSEWVDRDKVVRIYHAIAEIHAHDERAVYDDLVRCGAAMGGFATGTFLKLILKVLTPRLFAKKFPDMWARDHQRGRIEIVSVQDTEMVMRFKDMEGYDHFAPVAVGWGGTALRGMGVRDLEMKVDPWSLAQPTAKEVLIVARWR